MRITRSATDGTTDTTKGSAEWFTGDVYIDPVAASPTPSRAQAYLVRYAQRSHGLAPSPPRAKPLRHRGDRTMSAPRRTGRGHFAPATASTSSPMRSTGTVPAWSAVVHLALNEVDDEHVAVHWGEHVTDDEYNATDV